MKKFMRKEKFTRTLVATAVSLAAGAVYAQSEQELQEMTVTASGYAQSVKEAPASVTVISSEEIQRKSYTTVAEILKNVPGVSIAGGGAEQSVRIRGMGADYTLFLVDGRPQQDNQAFGLNGSLAGNPVNFLPPVDTIERIEVIRGPASALYGSDAMGGVINIITKKVTNKFSGNVSSEFVAKGHNNDINNDYFKNSFALNVPVVKDTFSLQINGSYQRQEESDFVGRDDASASDPKYKNRNFGLKGNLKVDARNTVTFGGSHANQERWAHAGKSLNITADDSYSKSVRDSLFVTHEGRYDNMLWESYVNYEESKNPTRVRSGDPESQGIKFKTLSANTQATWFLENHSLTAGANFKQEKLMDDATNAKHKLVSNMGRDSYAVFLEDNWKINEDLSLLLSGRVDNSDDFGTEVSPKIYAVYNATETIALKGGMTSGYKTPSLRQAAPDFAGGSMGGATIGNPDLKPEKSRNFELALEYESLDSRYASSFTVFNTNFKDKIQRSLEVYCKGTPTCMIDGIEYPGGQSNGYTKYSNIDEANIKGVEWTFDWKVLKNLTYRHSYTYTKSKQKSGDFVGKPLNDVPKHMLNVMFDWQATSNLNVWTQANYRGESAGAWSNKSKGKVTPAHTFMDVGMSYAVNKDVDLKFGIYNLTNRKIVPDANLSSPTLDGRRYAAAMNIKF